MPTPESYVLNEIIIRENLRAEYLSKQPMGYFAAPWYVPICVMGGIAVAMILFVELAVL
jgi:hypothetical protein